MIQPLQQTANAANDRLRKVLVISPIPTHPCDAGNRARILSLVESMQNCGHEVHFALIRTTSGDEKAMHDFVQGHYFPISYTKPKIKRTYIERIVDFLRNRADPYYKYANRIDDWFNDWALVKLREYDAQHHFDVVIVEYVFFSKALEAFAPHVHKIIDTHDLFTDRHLLFIKQNMTPQWFSTTQKEEARGLKRADVVLAIQDSERDFFAKISGRQVVTIGPVMPVTPLYRGIQGRGHILFVGSYNAINTDAIAFLLGEIWPHIKRRLPQAKLLIAGGICEDVPDMPDVEKLGVVPDLKTAYAQADVVAVPVRFGTGLNIKTIEALAYGMPVVSTSDGAHGLGCDDKVCRTLDDAEAFAAAVVAICTDGALAARLSTNSLDFVQAWNTRYTQALDAAVTGAY